MSQPSFNTSNPPTLRHMEPYLRWIVDPRYLSPVDKRLAVLKHLQTMNISPVDLLLDSISSDPAYKSYQDGFYRGSGLERLLNFVGTDGRGSKKLGAWMRPRAIQMVLGIVEKEMEELKDAFRMSVNQVTPAFLRDFDLKTQVISPLDEKSPVTRSILLRASNTSRGSSENTVKDMEASIAIIQVQLVKMRSQNSMMCPIAMGFYLYSCGLSRKVFDMLSRCGLSPSYKSLHESHKALAAARMLEAQLVALGPIMLGYDNTQITTSVHVEQRSLAPPKVQVGTTSMIYPLRNTTMQDIELRPILEARITAPIITFNADIRPTSREIKDLSYHLLLDIIKILIDNHSGFAYLKNSSDLRHHSYRPLPPGYKTLEYVCRTTTLEEGSTEGNAKVVRNVLIDQLMHKPEDLNNKAIPCVNDQSTNARIRSAQFLRARDVTAVDRMSNLQLGIGFFHCQLNLLWAILNVHRGSVDDPGSLQYFISLLHRVRLGTEHPDYHTLRSFTYQVLFGQVLLFWEIESGQSLDTLAAAKPDTVALKEIAQKIIDNYVSEQALKNASGAPGETEDSSLRNTILLIRDLLLFYELSLSISSGDFGRVELMLGTLTMMFAGAGCKNYTTEFLHFIQNLKRVWNPRFADVMRDNLLINMSGCDGHSIGVDKNAETNINFQKAFHLSKGLHGTWDQLADLGPTIPILRPLKTQFTRILGAPWQGITHSTPDITAELRSISSKARELELYIRKPNRETKKRTVDILAKGREDLQKKTLKAFSKRYTAWIEGTEMMEDELDEIPIISIDTTIEL